MEKMTEKSSKVEEQKDNLGESISKEIISTSIDLGVDYAEIPLDAIFDSDIVKEIPFIKTLYAVGKIGYNIKERFFAKKILAFLKEFHQGTIQSKKLDEFKKRFQADHQYRTKVTEHVIIYTEAFLEMDKAKIFGRLFSAYISGEFDWSKFRHLSVCLNNLNPEGYRFLAKLSNSNFEVPEDRPDGAPPRDFASEALLVSAGIGYDAGVWSSGFYVTDVGKDLFIHGIKDRDNNANDKLNSDFQA